VSEACPIGEAAVRAVAAGHDLLLVCHTEAAQRAATAALVEAYRSGRLPLAEGEAAAARVRRLRLARGPRREGGAPAPEPDGRPLAQAIATRAVTEIGRGTRDLAQALNGRVAVVFPRFSDLAPRITIEPEIADERGWIAAAFGTAGIAPEAVVVGIEPTPEEIATATERATAADATVLFLFDAHLYASNRALLEALQGRARRLAVALLRDPYDAALLGPGVRGLTAYGFRKCQLDAVVARLTHS
jgi:beta-N-acetylhexosaminidase